MVAMIKYFLQPLMQSANMSRWIEKAIDIEANSNLQQKT